jgi:inorganic pyrophosphatase
MPNFINLPAFTEGGDVRVVIETPRGSRAKLAYDPELKAFTLSKIPPRRTDLSARLGLCALDKS